MIVTKAQQRTVAPGRNTASGPGNTGGYAAVPGSTSQGTALHLPWQERPRQPVLRQRFPCNQNTIFFEVDTCIFALDKARWLLEALVLG